MTSTAGPRPQEPKRARAAVRDRAVSGVLVVVLVAAAFVIALPRVAAPPASSSSPSASPSAADAVAVYREGVVGRPESITPVTERTRADRTLVGLVYSGLVKMGPGDTLVPDLASSWQVDKAGQVWTVSIRQDALWQDGQPVTAADVVYTVAALKDPAASGGLAAAWADVTVQAIDPHTVQFTLGAPVGGFLVALTQPLLPAHLLSTTPMRDLATSAFATSPVGTGPYALAQLDDTHAVLMPSTPTAAPGGSAAPPGGTDGSGPGDPGATSSASSGAGTPASGDRAASAASEAAPAASSAPSAGSSAAAASSASVAPSLSAASSAPGASGATAASAVPTALPTPTPDPNARPVARIEITFYDTEAELAAAFAAGQIDGAAGLSPVTTSSLQAAPGASMLDYPTTTLSAVLLNLRPSHPELQDPTVRKALLTAIDRATIATTTLGGQARVAQTLVPPESWVYDAAKVGVVDYDLASAAKLLSKAGWTKKSGKWYAPKAKTPYAITLLTVSPDVNPRLAAIADAVKTSWTALGLSASVEQLTGTELAARLKSGDFSAAVLDIAMGLEPDLYPLLDSTQVRANGSNRSGYQDPAMDKLLEAARHPGTTEQRTAAWAALLAGLAAKVPVLPVVWADEQMVARGLSGASPRLIDHTGDRFWDVLAWRLAASR